MLLNVGLGEAAFLDETVGVLFEGRLLLGDGGIHTGLGERRLVGLVVSVTTVADNVDDNILLESGTPVGCELRDESDGFDIITVDVEDGSIDRLGQCPNSKEWIARIEGRW